METERTTRPFRFGVAARKAGTRAEWIDKARRIEAAGFDVFGVPDHFGDQLSPIAALMAAADATTDIRLTSYVFDNDFRHPVVTAREAATLDLLSDGRFELGIGAGWRKADYDAAGLEFDPPRTRVDRFEEAIEIIEQFFAFEEVTFDGTHYQVRALKAVPESVQKPHPPLLVGGGGARMLSIAARHAQIVSLLPVARANGTGFDESDLGPEAFDAKFEVVRKAAGERLDDLELNLLIQEVVITSDRRAAAEKLGDKAGLEPEKWLNTPIVLCGTEDEIVKQLLTIRDRYAITYITVHEQDWETIAPFWPGSAESAPHLVLSVWTTEKR